MKPFKLMFLLPIVIACALPGAHAQPVPAKSAPAAAKDGAPGWPTRPVRLVVGFTTGGPVDITARLLAPKLAELWGQPVVIENRAGGGGSIASVLVAQATPDGRCCSPPPR